MIAFQDFLLQVFSQLTRQGHGERLTFDIVEQTLLQAGLRTLWEQESIPPPALHLRLQRISIKGSKRKSGIATEDDVLFSYNRLLFPGINGWIAGNGAGKSTILKAIVWGLTGVEQHFKQDIRSWIDEVALEISISSVVYTIVYSLHGEKHVTGGIFRNSLEAVLQNADDLSSLVLFATSADMQQAIDQFFCEHLQFPEVTWIQENATLLASRPKKVSWKEYGLALFIGSDYSDYLLAKSYSDNKPHQKTLSAYLGLGWTHVLTKLEEESDRAQEQYKLETRRQVQDEEHSRRKVQELQTELAQVTHQIQRIDEGKSVLVNPGHLTSVQQQLASATQLVGELTLTQQDQFREHQNAQKKRTDLQRTQQWLREAVEFKLFFSGLAIERCPHCEQDVPPERMENEMQTRLCRLCSHPLQPTSSTEHYDILLEENQQQIEEQNKILQELSKEMKGTARLLQEAEAERGRHQQELQDLHRQERAGFTQEIRELIDRQGYLKGQLEQLQTQTKDAHNQVVESLKDAYTVFHTALVEMRRILWQQYDRHWRILEKHTTELAKLFGVTDLDQVSFQERFGMAVRQGGNIISFRDLEMSERLRLKLAFHLALLIARTVDGVGRHPGVLIIDAPGNAEMDEQHFQCILQGFSRVKEQLGDQIQIFIASTKPTLASVCDDACLEIKHGNEALF
jgi:hypothetical protein